MADTVVELDNVTLTSADNTEVLIEASTTEPCIENKTGVVEGYKKEYSIVGDGLYASVSAEEAPQWLVSLIDSVVGTSLANGLTDVELLKNSVLTALSELDVAKNQYQELINIEATIEGVVANRLATLNATVDANSATITDLEVSKVTADEALAIAASHLASEVNDGSVSAAIGTLQTTLTTPILANANSIDTLSSTVNDPNTGLSATANATQSLQTYVGIDAAGASSGTGLSAYLEGSDGEIGTAGSQLLNDIEVGAAVVESKFAYNSNLNINGDYYNSGFGISSQVVSGTGTENDPYDSEFWINAEKFKFTNSNNETVVNPPFSIDASGTTPQVTFNGIVNFTNTDMSAYDNSNVDTSNLALADMSNVTTIDGGKVTTGSLDAAAITAGTLKASQLVASNDGSTTWSGGGLISSNFNGNSYGDIGNPTLGFRLSSDAVGSDEDPNIYGAFIKGGEVNGAIIRGSSIIFTQQLRATAAGEPFYSYGIPTNNGTTVNLTKDRYSNDVVTTSPFGFYAYNALPNGLEEPDHFMANTVAISIGVDSYCKYSWTGGVSSFKADVYTSNGTFLSTLCNVSLPQSYGTYTVTQNGITVTRICTEVTGDINYDTLSLSVSGTSTFNFSGYDTQKLKVIFTVGNWGLGSGGTTDISASASVNTG